MRRLELTLTLLAIGTVGLANAADYPSASHDAALAQQSERPRTEVPPPPPLDEPAPAEAADDTATSTGDSDVVTLREAVPDATEKVLPEARAVEDPPLPEKVKPSSGDADVSIRREGDNVIEEYRRSGQVYMVVVTPDKGPKYTYLDTDADGRLEGDPREGRARPVYYTLYEWE